MFTRVSPSHSPSKLMQLHKASLNNSPFKANFNQTQMVMSKESLSCLRQQDLTPEASRIMNKKHRFVQNVPINNLKNKERHQYFQGTSMHLANNQTQTTQDHSQNMKRNATQKEYFKGQYNTINNSPRLMHKYGTSESRVSVENEEMFLDPKISHNVIYSTYMPNSARETCKPQITQQNVKFSQNNKAQVPKNFQQNNQKQNQERSQVKNNVGKNQFIGDKAQNKKLSQYKSEQKPRQDIQVFKHQLDNDLQRLQVYIQNAEQAQSERRSTSWGKRKSNIQQKSQANIQPKNPQIQLKEPISYPYFSQNQSARNNLSKPIEFNNQNGLTERHRQDLSNLLNKKDKIQHSKNQSSSSSFQSINYNTGKHIEQLNEFNQGKKLEFEKELRDPLKIQVDCIEKNTIESYSDKEEETKIVQLLQDPRHKVNDRYHHGDKPLSIVSANFFDSLKSNKQKISSNEPIQNCQERPNSQLQLVDLQKAYQTQPHQNDFNQFDQVGSQASQRQFYDRTNQHSSQRESYSIQNQTRDMFQILNKQEIKLQVNSCKPNQGNDKSKDEYYYQLNQLEDRLQDINSINQKILNENKKLQTKNKHLHKKVIDLKCRVKQNENLQKQQDQFVAQIGYLEQHNSQLIQNVRVQEEQIGNLKNILNQSLATKIKYENIFKRLLENDGCRDIVLDMLKI